MHRQARSNYTDRQAGRQARSDYTDRQAGRQARSDYTDRQAGRQAGRQAQADRRTAWQADRQTYNQMNGQVRQTICHGHGEADRQTVKPTDYSHVGYTDRHAGD